MRRLLLLTVIFSLYATAGHAAPVVREAAGSGPAQIQSTVDLFRADFGGALNPNNGQTFETGRREINWDGVPDNFAAPNAFPPDFFNKNSPRGAEFSTPGAAFRVSRNAVQGQVRFGDINPAYTSGFTTFSAQRLFTPIGSTITDVDFFIPGTHDRAGVKGFGAVFSDVDQAGSSRIQYFDKDGGLLLDRAVVPVGGTATMSFLGATFDGDTPLARVRIIAGTNTLAPGTNDGGGVDAVALDDFIYGEPRDADGVGIDDNCPAAPNPDQTNTDGDKQGDICDADDDNDGTPDASDAFPRDAAEQADSDGDGVGDNAEAASQQASGGPGTPAPDPDADADGRADGADNCPAVANPDQADGDADGRGDACDTPTLSKLSVKRAKRGFAIAYGLSEASRVAFRVEKKGRDGKFHRVRGGFAKQGKPGANSFRFSGKLGRRLLRDGRYRLVAVAADPAGQKSAAARRGFTVKR